MTESPRLPNLADARTALEAADALVSQALSKATEITAKGERIDDHQVLAERVAYAATEARAARELVEAVAAARAEGTGDALLETVAAASAAQLATRSPELAVIARSKSTLRILCSLSKRCFTASSESSVRARGGDMVEWALDLTR